MDLSPEQLQSINALEIVKVTTAAVAVLSTSLFFFSLNNQHVFLVFFGRLIGGTSSSFQRRL